MLAIPVFRARVAPVLNWCSRILVIPEDAEDSDEGHEILFEKTNIYELLQILKGIGVKTVICGALTPDLLNYGERLGVRMICGVAGHVAAVFQAFHAEKLHQPDFRLPGCGCRRKVRQSGGAAGVCEAAQERSEIMPNGRGQRGGGKGMGAGRKRGQGQGRFTGAGGEAGSCVCPQCGREIKHERGIPCAQWRCPECDHVLMRK